MTPSRPQLAVEASFERLAIAVPATIGMAIALPGEAEVLSLGRWPVGVAWSTIKVPLTLAALRSDPSPAKGLAVKVITESDNPASERLWSLLGEPAEAARRVQAVLRESGDTATVVETQRIRPGFTAFGQTQWALVDQARFALHLAGVPDAAGVIDLMCRIANHQRWGLAAKGVAAKGGWGPGAQDGYLVRQFGIVPMGSGERGGERGGEVRGEVGVALAAEARVFDAGVDVVNRMTEWLFDHLPELAQQ